MFLPTRRRAALPALPAFCAAFVVAWLLSSPALAMPPLETKAQRPEPSKASALYLRLVGEDKNGNGVPDAYDALLALRLGEGTAEFAAATLHASRHFWIASRHAAGFQILQNEWNLYRGAGLCAAWLIERRGMDYGSILSELGNTPERADAAKRIGGALAGFDPLPFTHVRQACQAAGFQFAD
jgi:hypothetical protein